MDIRIRPVSDEDAGAINTIHAHYVEKTVITFQYEAYNEAQTLEDIHAVRRENLPFIVAVDSADLVLGYMSAASFRPPKRGYHHSVEFSLFCHPQHTGRGVGSMLMELFLRILREPKSYPEYLPDADSVRSVKQVVAGMAIDTDGPRQGIALKEFYERFGFKETARLPQIGYKFDKWIDVLFMQLALY